MKKLSEILEKGSIPMLMARRRQLTGYRTKLEKQPYSKDDRIAIQNDIDLINNKLRGDKPMGEES